MISSMATRKRKLKPVQQLFEVPHYFKISYTMLQITKRRITEVKGGAKFNGIIVCKLELSPG